MSQIISVVPNVCEGRDEAFVAKVQERLEGVPGLVVLDVSMDQVRNRTIFSFTGSKEAIFQGGFLLYEEALGKIDMRQHEGSTPASGRSTSSRSSPCATRRSRRSSTGPSSSPRRSPGGSPCRCTSSPSRRA